MKDLIKKLLNENDAPRYTDEENLQHAIEMMSSAQQHLFEHLKRHATRMVPHRGDDGDHMNESQRAQAIHDHARFTLQGIVSHNTPDDEGITGKPPEHDLDEWLTHRHWDGYEQIGDY